MYDDKYLEETLKRAFEDPLFYNVPKGIRRHDYTATHGWFLRMFRNKVPYREVFSDGVWGSIHDSLEAAIIRRHEILSSTPVTIKKISNRGLPLEPEKRIKRHVLPGKRQPYIYWKARWYDNDHKVQTEQFAVYTLGEEQAYALALEAATKRHNRKLKLSPVKDPYLELSFEPIERADVEIYASINSPKLPSSSTKEDIINNDPHAFEGERKLVLHQKIERDRALRNKKIAMFIEEHESIFCELCHFSFAKAYPFLKHDIIEVHHIVPLSTLSKGDIVKLNDLMLLCSNCHFAIHQGDDAEENLLIAMDHFENKDKENC
jgi:hypothetical protein